MGYRSLAACVSDLERTGRLAVIDDEIDPHLEAAAIQRRVYQAGGPALYFRRVKGTSFPLVSNLFGTLERARFLFRDTLQAVRRLVELKVDPGGAAKHPWRYRGVPRTLWHLRPRQVRRGPILENQTRIDRLPGLQSWPMDGGPFITLPLVYTEHPDLPGLGRSNLGMYRVQLAGNAYERNREVGLHYQIHRGIGVHHAAAIRRREPLRASVFVGGPPALTVAAVMPLPEGLPELAFAGALGGRRVLMVAAEGGLPMPAEADFVITGTIDPDTRKLEGPFGDHLGYYSLAHEFPVLRVETVYHRNGAIWPFTSVGRPPQEDTTFGALIHELTGPIIPTLIAGDPHDRQRHPRSGAAFAGEVPADRRGRGRSGARHSRHSRVPASLARADRLDQRPAFPDADHHRHPRLFGARAEPGVEGRDGRRRPEAPGAPGRAPLRNAAPRRLFPSPPGSAGDPRGPGTEVRTWLGPDWHVLPKLRDR